MENLHRSEFFFTAEKLVQLGIERKEMRNVF
jgi:hypothetical protein